MRKSLFYSGAGFLGLEAIGFLSFMLYNSDEALKITGIALFVGLNLMAIAAMVLGLVDD